MRYVCGDCGNEQGTLPKCDRCGCIRVVHISAIEGLYGPDWRERCFPRTHAAPNRGGDAASRREGPAPSLLKTGSEDAAPTETAPREGAPDIIEPRELCAECGHTGDCHPWGYECEVMDCGCREFIHRLAPPPPAPPASGVPAEEIRALAGRYHKRWAMGQAIGIGSEAHAYKCAERDLLALLARHGGGR